MLCILPFFIIFGVTNPGEGKKQIRVREMIFCWDTLMICFPSYVSFPYGAFSESMYFSSRMEKGLGERNKEKEKKGGGPERGGN